VYSRDTGRGNSREGGGGAHSRDHVCAAHRARRGGGAVLRAHGSASGDGRALAHVRGERSHVRGGAPRRGLEQLHLSRDAPCPISTGCGTRRVHLVRVVVVVGGSSCTVACAATARNAVWISARPAGTFSTACSAAQKRPSEMARSNESASAMSTAATCPSRPPPVSTGGPAPRPH
jgi:hypothetical protein